MSEPEKQVEIMPQRDGNGRWVPGQSGNPKGRPCKGACLTDALRAELDAPCVLADGSEGTRAQRLAEVVVALALAGEKWACELAWDRTEGRPTVAYGVADGDGVAPVGVVNFRVIHSRAEAEATDTPSGCREGE